MKRKAKWKLVLQKETRKLLTKENKRGLTLSGEFADTMVVLSFF